MISRAFLQRRPEGDVRRAGLFAEAAVAAPLRHVERLDQMEDRDLRRHEPGPDELRIVEGAGLAKTGGADVPAPAAADAFGKLAHPVLELLLLTHPLPPRRLFGIGDGGDLVALHDLVRVGLGAFAGLRRRCIAGNAETDDLLPLQLLVPDELDHRPLIAAPDDDAEATPRDASG